MTAFNRLAILAWSALLVVTALLGALILGALDREDAANLREARNAADNLLGFSARVLESDLQAGRYADLQVYVDQLARTHPQVSRVRVIAGNGATLASFGPPAGDPAHYSASAEIRYAYQGRATLELAINLAEVKQRHRRLELQAGGILAAFALLLAALVHFMLRQRADAVRLRARGSELERARESAAIGEARAKELNRTLTVLRRCNEALVRAPSEQSLLEAMCALLVEVGGYRLAWIGYAEHGEDKRITLRAAAGRTDYLKGISLSWADGPTGNGPAGRAVRLGEVVWIRDTLTDPGYTPWRGLAADFGVRSVIALPLGNARPASGMLCIYAPNPSPYSPEELSLLTELAADISYGIHTQRSQRSLRETTERLQQIAASIREVFWMTGISDGRLLYVSQAFETIWQRPLEDLYANPLLWRESIHPDDRERVQLAAASTEALGDYDQEYRITRPDGSVRWIREQASPVRDADGRIYRVAGTAEDITERKEYEARLAHQDRHDLLTGIANRNRLTERLDQLLTPRSVRQPLAVAVLDLDRFRFINDSQGQRAGDAVLRDLAVRLHAAVRPGDLVARLGGDQFALVLASEESPDGALQNLRTIQQRAAADFRLADTPVALSCSIGVAFYPDDGSDVSGLLRAAETALQAAKQAGKGRIHAASGDLDRQLTERIRLERYLHDALAKQQFTLAYQAKIDTHSRRIVGAEALIRWNHPELGPISPAQFIPIAEDTGLIMDIGAWVLETASRQLRLWHDSGLPRIPISVNLSAEQFKDGSLPAQIEACLARTGLPARYLDIEITESVVMGDSEQRMQMISRLKALGVQISIDDFGTGYSNMNYLKRLQPDRLKIDRGFVASLPGDPIDAAIASAVIALAHTLGMQVVAEGVETPEQLEFLRQRNCNEVQGFLFCRPIEARLFARMLERVALEPANPT